MSQTSPTPLKRLISEGVVIVASILLAFSIDAWWDEHKKDQDVRQILHLVELETVSNLKNLESSIVRHEEILAAIQTALGDRNATDSFQRAVISVEVFEPKSDALKTLVTTGMLGAVADVDLRMALSAFDGLAKELAEKELAATQFRDAARRRIASLGTPVYEEIPNSSSIYTDTPDFEPNCDEKNRRTRCYQRWTKTQNTFAEHCRSVGQTE